MNVSVQGTWRSRRTNTISSSKWYRPGRLDSSWCSRLVSGHSGMIIPRHSAPTASGLTRPGCRTPGTWLRCAPVAATGRTGGAQNNPLGSGSRVLLSSASLSQSFRNRQSLCTTDVYAGAPTGPGRFGTEQLGNIFLNRSTMGGGGLNSYGPSRNGAKQELGLSRTVYSVLLRTIQSTMLACGDQSFFSKKLHVSLSSLCMDVTPHHQVRLEQLIFQQVEWVLDLFSLCITGRALEQFFGKKSTWFINSPFRCMAHYIHGYASQCFLPHFSWIVAFSINRSAFSRSFASVHGVIVLME